MEYIKNLVHVIKNKKQEPIKKLCLTIISLIKARGYGADYLDKIKKTTKKQKRIIHFTKKVLTKYEQYQKLQLTNNIILEQFLEARDEVGINAKPTIIGPYTFVDLSKGYDEKMKALLLLQLIPLYVQVINELTLAGAEILCLATTSSPAIALRYLKDSK